MGRYHETCRGKGAHRTMEKKQRSKSIDVGNGAGIYLPLSSRRFGNWSDSSLGEGRSQLGGRKRRSSSLLPDPQIMEERHERFEWEREKNELKSRIEELEGYKDKCNDLQQENERQQKNISQMYLGQSDASQKLLKTSENNDKLRLENKKKTEQIEKMQKEMRSMEDRIRNLEIRASEVDKAELILESTKQSLESTVTQLRGREHEIRKMTSEQDDAEKKLQQANEKIQDLDGKMLDLKYQVRQELMKNENIEKNLETIPRLKEEIKEKNNEVHSMQRDMDEKKILLTTSRKAVRDYRDQLRDVERKVSQTETVKEELDIVQCEVATLKKLLQGKDFLIVQKSKALDLAKDIIKTMQQSTARDQIEKTVRLLEKIVNRSPQYMSNGNLSELDTASHSQSHGRCKVHTRHENSRDIDVNKAPYPADGEKEPSYRKRPISANIFHEIMYGSNEDLRTKTAIVRPVKRTSSYKETASSMRNNSSLSKRSHYTSEHSFGRFSAADRKRLSKSLEITDGIVHSKDCKNYDSVSHGTHSPRGGSHGSPRGASPWIRRTRSELSLSDLSSLSSDDEDAISMSLMNKLAKLSSREKEDILCKFVSPGDRVLISVPQKPPRYGKKIVPKPKTYTGIVKYIGNLDKPGFDPRMHVGMRLDDPVGETDGMYKGKRYMYTPFDQGRFFKLLDATSVLNVKEGKYKLLSTLLCKHIQANDKD